MSMKSYREDAAKSKQEVLSRNGFSPKSNEPEGMISRSREIGRMAEKRGGKVHKAKGGEVEHKMHGEKAKSRMDYFARGGNVKGKGKTTVNVVIAGQGGGQPRPVPVPVPSGPPAGAAPPPMPPRPPMPAPGGPPMGAPVGAMPPAGMAPPMRKRGGKVEKDCDGGSVKRAAGGRIGKTPTDAGAGSGEGRLEKAGLHA